MIMTLGRRSNSHRGGLQFIERRSGVCREVLARKKLKGYSRIMTLQELEASSNLDLSPNHNKPLRHVYMFEHKNTMAKCS